MNYIKTSNLNSRSSDPKRCMYMGVVQGTSKHMPTFDVSIKIGLPTYLISNINSVWRIIGIYRQWSVGGRSSLSLEGIRCNCCSVIIILHNFFCT